jgi:HlyD family secretion protein
MRPSTRRPRWPLLALCLLAGCGGETEVALIHPRRGVMQESFREPARTRLAHTHRIVMPVAGTISRIELEPGDPVEAGQVLAAYDLVPFQQAVAEAEARVAELEAQITVKEDEVLENTALENVNTTIDAAEEVLRATQAQVEAERARDSRARQELLDSERLAAEGALPENQLLDVRLRADTAAIELRKQEFMEASMATIVVAMRLGPRFIVEYLARKRLERAVVVQQLAQARAQLVSARHELDRARITSPVAGVVLARYEQGAGPLPEGRELLLLGDPEDIEVIADVLTQDAQRLTPGARVELQAAAGLPPFAGRVLRIEPAGFTKLSSLGVEQQRVNVIVGLDERPAQLGVGYRVTARFFTGQADDAVTVPRYSVLQAPDGAHYVLAVQDGALVRRPVTLGLQTDLELQITDGLTATDSIVAAPDAELREGQRVRAAPQVP